MLNSLNAIANKTVLMISEQNWIIKLSVAGLAMLAPLKMYIHFLILLLVVDLITSVYYQYRQNLIKLHQSKKVNHVSHARIKTLFLTIESSRLRTTFEKLVALFDAGAVMAGTSSGLSIIQKEVNDLSGY